MLAQNLLGICPEFARNSEFARNLLGIRLENGPDQPHAELSSGGGGGYTRETGTIWQIGVLTSEWSIFGPKRRDFGPFRTTFSVKKFGPLLLDRWSGPEKGKHEEKLRRYL